MLTRTLKEISKQAVQRLKDAGQSSEANKSRRRELRIYDLYEALLDRQPDVHELNHWKTFLGIGHNITEVATSLIKGPEYQQKAATQQKVLIELQKFKLYVMEDDLDVSRNIIDSHTYEPHVTNALVDVLKDGDVFLDLGANIGYYSMLAAGIVRESGKVISFEPNQQNLQLLFSSIVENQFKNIEVYPLAASDAPMILKLTSFGSNGYLEAAPAGNSNFQFVQSVVVDEILQHESRINVIKMDIEGYETLALRGMEKLIRKHRPIIFTEFSPWHIKHRCQVEPQDYLRQLTQHGYALSVIEFSGPITSFPDSDAVMSFWHTFCYAQQHFDLMAQPI